jgi:hypothetical protein
MMNRQQQRKLKKHPAIRAIRAIFRLLRVIFRPARPVARPIAIDPVAIERAERERAEFERAERADREHRRIVAEQQQVLAEKYITVGALLDRVEWKFAATPELELPSATNLDLLLHDVSLN